MENVVTYARKNKKDLLVTIRRSDGEKSFRMTAKQLSDSIKRHCFWYNTMQCSKSWNDYGMTIRLLNGIQFDIILY